MGCEFDRVRGKSSEIQEFEKENAKDLVHPPADQSGSSELVSMSSEDSGSKTSGRLISVSHKGLAWLRFWSWLFTTSPTCSFLSRADGMKESTLAVKSPFSGFPFLLYQHFLRLLHAYISQDDITVLICTLGSS